MSTNRLGNIAYARSGDKGASANIGVIAHTPAGYEFLRDHLDTKRIETYFAPMRPGKAVRYEWPAIGALNFVIAGILDGGGSVTLRIDAQGKALGQILLEMPIEVPDDLLPDLLEPRSR
jgi:hypothetical protein